MLVVEVEREEDKEETANGRVLEEVEEGAGGWPWSGPGAVCGK